MRTPQDRLEALSRSGAVALLESPTRVESYSNDTWLARSHDGADVVLRVCWIGDRQRLLREAAVGAALPAELGYPAVLGSGTLTYAGETVTWMLCRRLSGSSLMEVWPDLAESQQERALQDVLHLVQRLHHWRPPAALVSQLGPPAPATDPDAVVGSTMLPLPLDRVRQLVEPAAARAPEHGPTVRSAWRWLVDQADLLPVFDDPATGVLVHGDLHLGNVWWDGDRVSGLLDLEWVRLAPGWVDLGRVLDNASAGDDLAAAHDRMLTALRPAIGEGVTDLDRRLAALVLSHEIRQVLVWPPPGADPAYDHPVLVLQRILSDVG
jgi:aminoglycoside phosphotransferase (APT) family kinase protein